MQPSRVSFRHGRADDVERSLAAVAALLWVVVVGLAFWLDQYRLAPTEGLVLALGLVEFVLALVVMPFTIGACVAWRRRAHAHRILAGAGVAVLAQWAWLASGVIAGLVLDPQRVTSYFSIDMNVIGSLAALLVFGLDGAAVGAAGGATTALVRRRFMHLGRLAGAAGSPPRGSR